MRADHSLSFLLTILLTASFCAADPAPNETLKFSQAPMLATTIGPETYCGHDEQSWAQLFLVNDTLYLYNGPQWMADDFADTVSADIVHVEWWGSYLNNQIPPTPPRFLIEFLSDIPASGEPGSYSQPGQILLAQVVRHTSATGHPPPGFYTETLETTCNPMEYVFRYNAHLKNPFPQQADTVYWLKIVALIEDPFPLDHTPPPPIYFWGWHNRDYIIQNTLASPNVFPGEHVAGLIPPDIAVWHFQDDAVQGANIVVGVDAFTDNVAFLQEDPTTSVPVNYVFPLDGPEQIGSFSKDLAFRLYYGASPPRCVKWSQPPDCEIGLDVESWRSLFDSTAGSTVADDWLCDGRPISGLRWWGSYIGWQSGVTNRVPPPFVLRPDAFRVTWYTDVPASGTNFSRPGEIIRDETYLLSPTFETPTPPGTVSEYYYCLSDLSSMLGPGAYEHEYVYEVQFPNEPWNEKEGNIYWLSVEAQYFNLPPPPANPWGWKTTPPMWNFNDDAVFINTSTNEMHYPPPGWTSITNHPHAGQSVNMAFDLITHVCPSRCKKWEQAPDMRLGDDMPSWAYITNMGGQILRATDFISDGRLITDIHWWGSYIGWESGTPGGNEANPINPPDAPDRPLGFLLSWHASTPGCQPGTLLTNIFVTMNKCHETYFGTVTQFWRGANFFEHEYQYYVDLLDPDVSGEGWPEVAGEQYWLNIQAIFPTNFAPDPFTHFGWGWKLATLPGVLACPSVISVGGSGIWSFDSLLPPHPLAGMPFDLSFELTTTELAINAGTNVVFTRIAVSQAVNRVYLWTTGHVGCGAQTLQHSPNLMLGEPGWSNIQTRINPVPANLWQVSPISTQRFYRVLSTN